MEKKRVHRRFDSPLVDRENEPALWEIAFDCSEDLDKVRMEGFGIGILFPQFAVPNKQRIVLVWIPDHAARRIAANHDEPVKTLGISQRVEVGHPRSIAFGDDINGFVPQGPSGLFDVIGDLNRRISAQIDTARRETLSTCAESVADSRNGNFGKKVATPLEDFHHFGTIQRNLPVHAAVTDHDVIMP